MMASTMAARRREPGEIVMVASVTAVLLSYCMAILNRCSAVSSGEGSLDRAATYATFFLRAGIPARFFSLDPQLRRTRPVGPHTHVPNHQSECVNEQVSSLAFTSAAVVP